MPATETALPNSNRFWISVALLLSTVLTVLIYWPGAHGGFVMDDFPNIVDNNAVHLTHLRLNTLLAAAFSSTSGLLHRPISMLSFALNEYFWGPGPYSMKVTNIVIHACNGLLVYLVIALLFTAYRKRFRPEENAERLRWIAVGITAAWLFLPINLTAVLYVVQRMTSLSGTFVLAGTAFYLWGRLRMLANQPGLWMLWTAMATCGTLAVLSKEVGALLPVYTLLIEWILFNFERADGRRDKRLYLLYACVLILPGLLGLIWIAPSQLAGDAYAGRPFTLGERLLTEFRVVVDYIAWSIVPNLRDLSLYHDDFPLSYSLIDPPATLAAIALIGLLLWVAVRQRKRWPLVSLGIVWFFAGQLLTATVLPLELVYEHRNYLPSLGLLLTMFSFLTLEFPTRRLAWARHTLIIGLIVLYGAVTTLRAHQWANPMTFAATAAADHPHSPRATYALARVYTSLVRGPNSPFLAPANQALERAAAVPQANILPLQGLLIVNAKAGRALDPQWWKSMERKLSSGPASAQDVSALYSMVECELRDKCQFPDSDMTRVFGAALKRNPQDPTIVAVYSNYVLNVLREPPLARELMIKAIRMAPSTPQYWVNLIKLDIFLRSFDAAHYEIRQLARLNHLGSLDETIRNLQLRFQRAQATRQPLVGKAPSGPNERAGVPSHHDRPLKD